MSRELSSLGVPQKYGPIIDNEGEAHVEMVDGPVEVIKIQFNYDDANNGIPAINQENDSAVPLIPAGSLIKSATLQVGTAFTSGGSATLELGTQEPDGSAIDANGIDSLAVAALTAGSVHVCDGALIGAVSSATLNSQVSIDDATAVFTAGSAVLTVEYVPPYSA